MSQDQCIKEELHEELEDLDYVIKLEFVESPTELLPPDCSYKRVSKRKLEQVKENKKYQEINKDELDIASQDSRVNKVNGQKRIPIKSTTPVIKQIKVVKKPELKEPEIVEQVHLQKRKEKKKQQATKPQAKKTFEAKKIIVTKAKGRPNSPINQKAQKNQASKPKKQVKKKEAVPAIEYIPECTNHQNATLEEKDFSLNDLLDQLDPGSDVEFTPVDLEDVEGDEGVMYSTSLHVTRFVWAKADEQMESLKSSHIADELKKDDDAENLMLPPGATTFTWSGDFSSFTGRREEFKGPAGPQRTFDTPYESFTAIWDIEIVTRIARETNNYVRSKILQSNQPKRKWIDTDANEIYMLLGMLSVLRWREDSDMYFNSNYFQIPALKNVMTFKRFKELIQFMHFVHNFTLTKLDGDELKMAKLKPIAEHCSKKFESLFIPYTNIAIDDSMPLYTGQYIYDYLEAKSSGYGKRIYECCDTLTGYVWRILLHPGRTKAEVTGASESHAVGIIGKLTEGIRGKGHTLLIDNCLNSPALARWLKRQGTDVVGAVRGCRRHVPPQIESLEKEEDVKLKGERDSRHCGDLSLNAWVDVLYSRYYCDPLKVVSVLSTFHDDSPPPADGGKPAALRYYEETFKGVALRDDKLEDTRPENDINLKWYMQAFVRIYNASLWNSFLLYRAKEPQQGSTETKKMSFSVYKQALFTGILDTHISDAVRTQMLNKKRLSEGSHFPYPVQMLDDKGKVKLDAEWSCERCKRRGVIRKADLACDRCEVGLCTGNCFKEYHTLEDLS